MCEKPNITIEQIKENRDNLLNQLFSLNIDSIFLEKDKSISCN